jgi:hypothetical protein
MFLARHLRRGGGEGGGEDGLVNRLRQPRSRLAIGRAGERLAAQMTDLGAGGVAVSDLLDEQRDGDGGIELAFTPFVPRLSAGVFDALSRKWSERSCRMQSSAATISAIRGLLFLVSLANTIVAGGHVLRKCRKCSDGAGLGLS